MIILSTRTDIGTTQNEHLKINMNFYFWLFFCRYLSLYIYIYIC